VNKDRLSGKGKIKIVAKTKVKIINLTYSFLCRIFYFVFLIKVKTMGLDRIVATTGALILGTLALADGVQKAADHISEQSGKDGTPSSEQYVDANNSDDTRIFSSPEECEDVTGKPCSSASWFPRRKEEK
jgi:hypothetical protein